MIAILFYFYFRRELKRYKMQQQETITLLNKKLNKNKEELDIMKRYYNDLYNSVRVTNRNLENLEQEHIELKNYVITFMDNSNKE